MLLLSTPATSSEPAETLMITLTTSKVKLEISTSATTSKHGLDDLFESTEPPGTSEASLLTTCILILLILIDSLLSSHVVNLFLLGVLESLVGFLNLDEHFVGIIFPAWIVVGVELFGQFSVLFFQCGLVEVPWDLKDLIIVFL